MMTEENFFDMFNRIHNPDYYYGRQKTQKKKTEKKKNILAIAPPLTNFKPTKSGKILLDKHPLLWHYINVAEPEFKIGDLVRVSHLLLKGDPNYGRIGLITKIRAYATGNIYLVLIDNLQEYYGEHSLIEV